MAPAGTAATIRSRSLDIPGGAGGDRDRIVAAHRSAAALYRAQFPASPAQRYLADRLGAVPAGWHLGYAPPGSCVLLRYLRRRGFSIDEAVAAGLASRHRPGGSVVDRFRSRVMFVVRDQTGDPVGFIGRSCPPTGRGPKYLNTPTTAAYCKSKVLFGLAEQRDAFAAGAVPVLVEGPTDVLAVTMSTSDHATPVMAAVAACGTAVTAAQLDALAAVRNVSSPLIAGFDGDRAGRLATMRLWDLLVSRRATAHARAAVLPAGCDPARVYVDAGPAALRHALIGASVPLVDAVVAIALPGRDDRDVSDADALARHSALRRAARVVAATGRPEDVTRLVPWLAERLALPYSTVTIAVVDAISPSLTPAFAPIRSAHSKPTDPDDR